MPTGPGSGRGAAWARPALAGLVALPLCSGILQQDSRVTTREWKAVHAALEPHDEGETEDDVVERLVALGPASSAALFAVLCGTGAPSDEVTSAAKRLWWGAPKAAVRSLTRALGRMPPRELLPQLEAETKGAASLAARLGALHVLAELRSASGVDLTLRLADALGSTRLKDPRIRPLVMRALTRSLDAEGESLRAVEEGLDSLEDDVLCVLAESLAESRRSEALDVLLAALGRDARVDVKALEAIAALCARIPWHFDDPGARLRDYLESRDPRLRRAAAAAVGRLHDVESFSALIELLSDPDAGVRRAAVAALRQLARTTVPSDAEAWSLWYEARVERWERTRESLAARLDSADPSQIMALVQELSEEAFFRDEAALALGELLYERPPEVQVAACVGLRRLRSAHPVPHLIDSLREPAEEVRQAAWEALRQLTGEDLPADPAAWEELLGT
jgi:HEAT repeat protein